MSIGGKGDRPVSIGCWKEVTEMGKRGAERYRLIIRGTGKGSLRAALVEAVWRRYRAER